jgi:hypothetical protein
MQKINTENINKYLQPEKIKRIYKILTLIKKSGGFEKSWRFYKNQADLRNLGALQKIRRFTKYWHFTDKQADERILAGIKIPAPGEISAGLEKAGGPLTV